MTMLGFPIGVGVIVVLVCVGYVGFVTYVDVGQSVVQYGSIDMSADMVRIEMTTKVNAILEPVENVLGSLALHCTQ
jgi:hypothetical protein